MRRVSLREANQNFSACIAEVEAGEHLLLERRGVPVAEIVPYRPSVTPEERKKALKELAELLEEGIPLGGSVPTRDEMHER